MHLLGASSILNRVVCDRCRQGHPYQCVLVESLQRIDDGQALLFNLCVPLFGWCQGSADVCNWLPTLHQSCAKSPLTGIALDL